MPQIFVGAAVAGGVSFAFGGAFLMPFASTVALGFVGQLMSPDAEGFQAGGPQSRQVMTRTTIAPRRWIFGRAQVSAANMPYGEATGTDQEFLHFIITLAQGPITGVDDILFDDRLVGARNGSGEVTAGLFANDGSRIHARIHVNLGTDDQAADAALVAESAGNWTTNHRGRGVAALVLRLHRDDKDLLFPQGIPQVRAVVRGVKAYDPRVTSEVYTTNPAILVRWFLKLAAPDGMGVDDAELDDTAFIAAANVCDERVAVEAYTSPAVTADAATDTLTFASPESRIGTGDGVTISSTGTLPGGLSAATTYYAIRPDGDRICLASSYLNAIAGTAIDISSAGTGTITLSHIDQARYTCNGVIESGQNPRDILSAILSTMSGALIYSEGRFVPHAGAWSAPTADLTPADLAGPVQVQVRPQRADLFNGIRGTYTDPLKDYQPTDFPAYKSDTYKAEDGDVEVLRDFDFQLIDNPIRAQRLAKLVLARARQGMQITLTCKLTAFKVALWDTVTFTHPHFGFDEKTFRVVGWSLRFEQAWKVILTLQEEDANVYGWTASEAEGPPQPPPLALPDPRVVAAPSNLTMNSGDAGGTLLTSADGTQIARVVVSWDAAPDANVNNYEVQYRPAGDASYGDTIFVSRADLTCTLPSVASGGSYYVRVRTVGALGARSNWLEGTHTVAGKTADPTAPTNLSVLPAVTGYDIVWTSSPDADYAYSELWEATSNDRATAVRLATIAGSRFARAGLPASTSRWYWVRDVDTSGNESDWYPSSATAGETEVTLAASGGVKTVTDASAITSTPGSDPPNGSEYWAVYDNTTGKIWRWTASGNYTKAADGGDLAAASVAADKISVATLSAISADLGEITAGSIDIGGGQFVVDEDGNVEILSATSGERMEIRNDVIKVYDSGGNLRVELGYLA